MTLTDAAQRRPGKSPRRTGLPGWAKVAGVLAVVVALLFGGGRGTPGSGGATERGGGCTTPAATPPH
ncbi:hypothetical protein, partial [Streptomyces chryseus]